MMKVKFDGYPFGDEVLEEVHFQADIQGNNVSNVVIDPSDDGEYWDGLNKSKWLKKAKKYIESLLKEYGDVSKLLDENYVIQV